MLEEADCGIAFEPSNDEELAAAAERLAAAPAEERRRLGENGRRYVLEHFDRRVLAHDYLEILERVRADSTGDADERPERLRRRARRRPGGPASACGRMSRAADRPRRSA